MKKEERRVPVQQPTVYTTETFYIAEDGRRFPTEQDCLKYEALLEIVENAEMVDDCFVPFGFFEMNTENRFRWMRLHTDKEVDAVAEVFNVHPNDRHYLVKDQWICIETAYYGKDALSIYSLEDSIHYFKACMTLLGFNVNVEAIKNAVCLFKVDAFYEIRGKDAQKAANALGLTITRKKLPGNEFVPVCGFPVKCKTDYVKMLIDAGMHPLFPNEREVQ